MDTVLVDLNWTYGVQVGDRLVYYGPGRVPVPREVAERRGWPAVAAIDNNEPPHPFAPVEERTDYPAADVAARAGVSHLTGPLVAAGFRFATHIAQAQVSDLTAISGIGPKTAEKLKAAAGLVLSGESL